MKNSLKLAFLCVLAAAQSAWADSRIITEIYNKSRVYDVSIEIGRVTLIQLEDDESLVMTPQTVLGLGDATAWDLGVRGNNIVFKPTQKQPDTNLIVVTNKRTYAFELKTAKRGEDATYVLRFRYPDSEAAAAASAALAEARRVAITGAAKAEKVTINTEYVWRGDAEALKPTAAYDDGRFTRLVYDHSGELPVFFKVLPDGTESLINSNIDPEAKNTVILHEVIRSVRARIGAAVIEIINKAYVLPAFNTNATGVHGTVRRDRGAL